MPKGDEIIIKAISTEDPNKVDIKIEIILDTKDESLDRRFSKYRWMDYYE